MQIRFHVEHPSIYSSCRAVWRMAVCSRCSLCRSSLSFHSILHLIFPSALPSFSPLHSAFYVPLGLPSSVSIFPFPCLCPVRLPPLHHLNFCVCLPALQSNSSPSPFLPSSQNSVRFVSDGHRPRVQLPFLNRNCFPSFQLPFLQSRPVFNLPAFFPTFL